MPLNATGSRARGDRARDEPGARADAAGHDDRVRRLAHLHARRVRRAGVRHRHVRGRARARDADADPDAAEDDADPLRGDLPFGVTAKDLVLGAIGRIGVAGGVGHAIEYAGPAIEALSMEGRMTVCNMSIEAGARAGMVAPDDTTFAYLEGRPAAPRGADVGAGARRAGARCRTDDGATFDEVVEIDVSALTPQVTWGTNPGMVAPVDGVVPDPAAYDDPVEREVVERALRYMDARAGHADPGDRHRPRLHRLVHERAHRGPARGGRRRRRAARGADRARDGRAGLGEGEAAGGGGGPRPRLHDAPASSGGRRAARCASA